MVYTSSSRAEKGIPGLMDSQSTQGFGELQARERHSQAKQSQAKETTKKEDGT